MQDHRSVKHLQSLRSLGFRNYLQPVAYEIICRRLRDGLIHGRQYPTTDQFNSYYKFTFVRNSWARVFSWYKNVMSDKRHLKRYRIPEDASFHWFVDNRLHTLKSQLFYITDADGEIAVDFIGRFENLLTDFATVCDTLGIEDHTLPERNRSKVQGHIDHYDDYLINAVRNRYRNDIDHFGFTFE